jgi:hypothetical protein
LHLHERALEVVHFLIRPEVGHIAKCGWENVIVGLQRNIKERLV